MDAIKEVLNLVRFLGVELTLDVFAQVLGCIAEGMDWKEALWYVMLIDQEEKTAQLAGTDVATVRKVMKARAQILG